MKSIREFAVLKEKEGCEVDKEGRGVVDALFDLYSIGQFDRPPPGGLIEGAIALGLHTEDQANKQTNKHRRLIYSLASSLADIIHNTLAKRECQEARRSFGRGCY